MSSTNIYTVGGTVQAGQGIYIPRRADDELLNLCRAGTFAYILTARQMGKSSLMVRTAGRLEEEGTHTALIDLTKLGAKASAEQWYLGFLVELADQLGLANAVLDWWQAQAHLPMAQRLSLFCSTVVLAEIAEPVVIFVDEIDSTLSLDFTDDFFAAIRALYNARAGDEQIRRLTFVLMGVATPGDLIRDPKRTPFNIGTRVELEDFSPQEAAPLAAGLNLPTEEATRVLGDVLHWTNGHPYLTQRLCRVLSTHEREGWDAAALEATVSATFFGEESERDHNLQFVRDMLVERSPDRIGVLKLYQAIRLGRRPVPDEEQSLNHAHLKLSGIVRRSERHLQVRNQIYATVFNPTWIKQHWPLSWWQGIPLGVRIAGGLALISLMILSVVTSLLFQALHTADERLRISNAQRLAFAAQSLPEDKQEPALQLAYYAYRLDQNSITEQVLHDLVNQRSWMPTTLVGHTDSVTSAVFSPDGTRILTASTDGTARLWDAQGQHLATLSGHTDQVTSAVFSPDGTRILTASADGTARLWDDHGQLLNTLSGHTDNVWNAVFSPNGTRILTASSDGTARLWDDHGQLSNTLSGHTGQVTSAVFSPDGNHILTASGDLTARLWDAQGQPLAILSGHTAKITSAIFSPDGTRILTASWDGTARLWDMQSKPLATLGHTEQVNSAVFSPDGTRILTASSDGMARLWNNQGQLLVTLSGHTERVYHSIAGYALPMLVVSAVFSPGGTHILTASSDGTAKLWDDQGQSLATLSGHTDLVNSAIFSPDSTRILTISDTVRLWQAIEKPLATLSDYPSGIISAVFSPNDTHIITENYRNSRHLWNTQGKLLTTLDGTTSAIFSPDGTRILTASGKAARLWDATGKPLTTLTGHTERINSAIFSPNGTRILTASDDGTTRLWDAQGQPLAIFSSYMARFTSAVFNPNGTHILTIKEGWYHLTDKIGRFENIVELWDASVTLNAGAQNQPIATLRGHTYAVVHAIFSPNSNHILTISQDGTARLWDAEGEPLATLSGHTNRVNSAVFSPDGRRILTASEDGTARLWDATGKPLATLSGHTSWVTSVVFSPDGTRILTASEDGTARLWDAQGQPLATLSGHTSWGTNAVFSPDGTRILTASADGTARLWDATGNPLATLTGHTDRVNSAVFSPDGRRILTASSDGTARQYFVYPEDLLNAAACRIGRDLTSAEIAFYNVPDLPPIPLGERVCPTLGEP